MRKIDLMIIGAQKAGTTSLNKYLNQHPDVLGHATQEFSYFLSDTDYKKKYNTEFKKFFDRTKFNAKVVVAKNVGIYNNQHAIERLYRHNPECKLVFMVREPVSRAISSYNMEVFNGWLDRDFPEIKTVIEKKRFDDVMYRLFICLGLYSESLEMILQYFPKEQLKIFLFENFSNNPAIIYNEICNWLNISPDYQVDFSIAHNATKKAKSQKASKILIKLRNNNNPIKKIARKVLPYSLFTKFGQFLIERNKSEKLPPPVPDDIKEFLYRYFEPYNKKFESMSALCLDCWNNKNKKTSETTKNSIFKDETVVFNKQYT